MYAMDDGTAYFVEAVSCMRKMLMKLTTGVNFH